MNIESQTTTIEVSLEDVLQLLELANRLAVSGYVSRTENNFVQNMSRNILGTINSKNQEQNNKIDESEQQ